MGVSTRFAEMIAERFRGCQDCCGGVNVPQDVFTSHVWEIACRHISQIHDEQAISEFAEKLYLSDLYLASGCLHNVDNAWKMFDQRYRRFIANLVRFCYRNGADNEEIADTVLVNLYFQDRSGRQRIASYDGRSSLATWLRVIVINRAINERNERKIAMEECGPEIPDCRALAHFESSLRAGRYGKLAGDALMAALRLLTPAERLMLLWRYEQNMALGDMARLLGIHQSNVTRRLLRLQTRLRESVIQILSSEYGLSSAAIQECLSDIIENPMISISLVGLIKEMTLPVPPAPGGRIHAVPLRAATTVVKGD